MAYTAYLDNVQKFYIGYYQRPADPEGLIYWAKRLDSVGGDQWAMINHFANSEESRDLYGSITTQNIAVVINDIYNALFNRDADTEGLTFYATGFQQGTFTAGTIMLNILDGAKEGTDDYRCVQAKLDVAEAFTNELDTAAEIAAYSGEDPAQVARDMLATVDCDTNVDTFYGIQNAIATMMYGDMNHVFTLTETYGPDTPAVQEVRAIYWGYNPHPHDEDNVDNTDGGNDDADLANEGPEDGGIPVGDLISFLTTITGLDLKELGLIDANGVDPFQNVTSITFAAGLILGTTGDVTDEADSGDAESDLTINFDDGLSLAFSINAEAVISQQYFNFLSNLLFDQEGNSRLYEKVIVEGQEAEAGGLIPIILTPYQNNGGTLELGNPSGSDDLIVAGYLELLHQAYIDAGKGYDILEIDAKGTYAQPKALLNIEEIRVQNLANVYTTDAGDGDGWFDNSSYPEIALKDADQFDPNLNSFVDLSRATSIQRLVVNEGADYIVNPELDNPTGSTGNPPNVDVDDTIPVGDLTIVGIRNNATTRLEGSFFHDVTLQYGQGLTGILNLELALGDVEGDINLLQNASTLNIDSQGVVNHMHNFFAGGSISRMYITGSGAFQVDENLAESFNNQRAVIVDANGYSMNGKTYGANEGGISVWLGDEDSDDDTQLMHNDVTVYGTAVRDEISIATTYGDIVVEAGEGKNDIWTDTDSGDITITAGAGNDNIYADADEMGDIVINAGDGNNDVYAETDEDYGDVHGNITITTGSGADNIYADTYEGDIVIDAGAGKNYIEAYTDADYEDAGNITITTLSGDDSIWADADAYGDLLINAGDGKNEIDAYVKYGDITITTGSGADVIYAWADDEDDWSCDALISIDSGAGNDNILAEGAYAGVVVDIASGEGADQIEVDATKVIVDAGAGDDKLSIDMSVTDTPYTTFTVDMGEGQDTVILFGGDYYDVVAGEGSSITGAETIIVSNAADISRATLTGVNAVQFWTTPTDPVQGDSAEVPADDDILTITAAQFTDLGPAKFSVKDDNLEGVGVDTDAEIHILVTENYTLGDMSALDGKGITLRFTILNGATLTLTAAQLHKYVAEDGIDSTDGLNGKVHITGAGMNFDAFDNGDEFQVRPGGTLSDSFFASDDVTIDRVPGGFDRPEPDDSTDTTYIDSTGDGPLTITDPIILGEYVDNPTTLKFIGDQDVIFAEGAYVELAGNGGDQGDTINFADLEGTLTGLLVKNFEDIEKVRGNFTDTRINVEMNGDVGSEEAGLDTRGVETYVVTYIDTPAIQGDGDGVPADTATFWFCDETQDVEVIGLKGNADATLILNKVPWGLVHPTILLEGDGYADWNGGLKVDGNPDASDIGNIVVNYFTAGAPAIVNINNGGVELGDASDGSERYFDVGYVTVTNAASLEINVTEGDAEIDGISGDAGLETLTLIATEDVTIDAVLPVTLETIDASDVAGVFTGIIEGRGETEAGPDAFTFLGAVGGSDLTLSDIEDGSHVITGGAGGVDLTIEGYVDLDEATLTNITSVKLNDGADLDIKISDVEAIGAANFSVEAGGEAAIDLFGLSDAPFTVPAFADGITIQEIYVAEDAAVVTLDAATTLTGIGVVVVPEGVTLNLSAAQFNQLAAEGHIVGAGTVNITGLTQADLDYDEDGDGVADGFDLTGIMTANVGSITLAEDVTIKDTDNLGPFTTINMGDGMTLTLEQLAQADGLTINGGADSVLKITDTHIDEGEASIDASGFNVSVLKVFNVLVDGENVDLIFDGLPETVLKEIEEGGWATPISQTVTIDPGVTVQDSLTFNPISETEEIVDFTLNMTGGVLLDGDLILSTTAKVDENEDELVHRHLQTLTINSTGTAANQINGDTDNVISGTITPLGDDDGTEDNNLLTVNINAEQNLVIEGGIVFSSVTGDDDITVNDFDDAVATLTVDGTADVALGLLDTSDTDVDDLNVVNSGTGTLTFELGDENDGDDLSFTGDNIEIIIQAGESVDLTEADLSGVVGIVLQQGATLELTMAQADQLGADNISLATGATAATLNLSGLDGEPFSMADYAEGITVAVLSLADMDVVTLHPDTDLTGIGSLEVPEGTTLYLTALQFQQLTGPGTITGDGTVFITDLDQAAASYDEDGDGISDGFDLSGITANVGTITMIGDVELTAADDLDGFEVVIGDGMTLTLAEIEQADGLVIGGGANTVLKFTDIDLGDVSSIDASGFGVTTVMMLNVLVAGENIDLLLDGLPEGVIKEIYNGLGWATAIDQTAVIDAQTTVPGSLTFNPIADDVEIANFTLNMLGGAELTGDLVLATTGKPDSNGLIHDHLQSLTINSSGTEANKLSGETDNIITGSITPLEDGKGTEENNLLDVTINASQNLVIEGDVIFNSVTGDDWITANDDDEATAYLNINGTADVTIEGDLDTSDNDVDALVVTHTGTGAMSIKLDGWDIDADDEITITGSATGEDIINIDDAVDLSDDTISNIDEVIISVDDGELTVTQAQFDGVGAGNFHDNDPDNDGAILNVVELGTGKFDATEIDPEVDLQNVTVAQGTIALHAETNLTGVDTLWVHEGSTVEMTAAQFQQLLGKGTINGIDTDGDGTVESFTVKITDLTQADIDYDVDNTGGETDGFDLTGIDAAAQIELTLAENVDLAANTVLGVDLTDPERITVYLTDGQVLGLANSTQADGLTVIGTGDTTLVYKFFAMDGVDDAIDASNYDVTTLKALATFVGGENVEYLIDDLASAIDLVLYASPEEMGWLNPTYRKVFIEPGVTVPGYLVFNDWDTTDEVRAVTITMEGGNEIAGNVTIPYRTDKDPDYNKAYFDQLDFVSTGTAENSLTGETYNIVDGNIDTYQGPWAANTSENNLLKVSVSGTQDFIVDGSIVFNGAAAVYVEDDAEAYLTDSSSGDVTITALNVSDDEIDVLHVANTGAGTLTITGASPAIFDNQNLYGSGVGSASNLESIIFSGSGDIVIGENADVATEYGIQAGALSVINASALTGDLALGEARDIDSESFSFTSGSGVTTFTLTSDTLDVNTDDDTGWSFNFASAAAGSEFHLGNGVTFTDGDLTINLGTNTTLYIDDDVDWTGVDLALTQTKKIVLTGGSVLTVTAEQADGLDVEGNGTVNIVDLMDSSTDNDYVYDFSGIDEDVAGTITLGENDVTVDNDTDLGYFSITLTVNSLANDVLSGQTIRFWTVDQAEREIFLASGTLDFAADTGANSTNVVWLFDNISGPVDTSGYFDFDDPGTVGTNEQYHIGRLWFSEDLVNNEGGLVESLFTTLPTSVLRVDFTDITELDVLLASQAVDRVMELVSFTNLTDLKFSDTGSDPEEHIASLTIQMGGEAHTGAIRIADVVASDDSDPATVAFNGLTIESYVALRTGYFLAPEGFINDNDGTDEMGEHMQPNDTYDPPAHLVNSVGNILVSTAPEELAAVDLMSVTLDTKVDSETLYGNPLVAGGGSDLKVGTITYDNDSASVALADHTAYLYTMGANDIIIDAVNTADPDIWAFVHDATGMTGGATVTGVSPALQLDNTEELIIKNDGETDAVITYGSATNPGIVANELSVIDASDYDGTLHLGFLGVIDSDNDDENGDGDTTDAGEEAFLFTSGTGLTTATLGALGGYNPALALNGSWTFDFTASAVAGGGTVGDLIEDSSLTIQGDDRVVFGSGDLDLDMGTAILIIDGNVDFTTLRANDLLTPATEGLFFSTTATVELLENATVQFTDEQWLSEGGKLTFVDEEGNPAVLHVTAAVAAALGGNLTHVFGYAAYDIDAGVTVTLREDQADVAYVAGDDLNPGTLTGANVTVYVQETGFGNQDVTNLTGIFKLVMEADTTDNDLVTPGDQLGYFVTMTVAQASDLVGDITKNGNFVEALAGETSGTDVADTFVVDLTDPAGDGSVPAYNLAEVDTLFVDDADGTIINLVQFNAIGGAAGISKGDPTDPVTLIASGDLSGVDLTGITNLIITANTTLVLEQVDMIAAAGGTITMDDPLAAYTLTINDAEAVGADALPDNPPAGAGPEDGDGYTDPNSTIDIDLGHVTVANVTVFLDTNTIDPTDGVTVIDGNYTVTGDLNGAVLSLTGNGTINADVSLIDGETVTGTLATVNLTDSTDMLDDAVADVGWPSAAVPPVDLSGVAAAIAGTVTPDAGDANVLLDPATDLGAFDVIAATDMFMSAAQGSGRAFTGANDVWFWNLGSAAVDLSGAVTTALFHPVELVEDPLITNLTLDPTTDLGIYEVWSGANVAQLTMTASQADGVTLNEGTVVFSEAGAVATPGAQALTDVVITGFENALSADLTGMISASWDTDVQLDSTFNVVIGAGADLSGLTGNSQVTISGTGTVTAADETAPGANDGADVSSTDFVVGAGATIVSDMKQADAASIVTINNVTGEGKLQVIADDTGTYTIHELVRYTEIVVDGTDDGITINSFTPDFFIYSPGVLDLVGRHSLNLNESLMSDYATQNTYAELGTGQFAADDGLVVYTGDIASVDEAGIEDLFDGTTTDFQFANNGDTIYLAADDGTDTYVWLIDDTNADGEFTAAADTATLIVTLAGVNDATDLVAANFTDF